MNENTNVCNNIVFLSPGSLLAASPELCADEECSLVGGTDCCANVLNAAANDREF